MHQRTHVQPVQTDSVSDASRPLDLDGLAVERVESGAFGGRGCAPRDWGQLRVGVSQRWGGFSVGQGPGVYPPARYPIRDTAIAVDLAQAAMVLQGETVRAVLVRRTLSRGPDPLEPDDKVAGRARQGVAEQQDACPRP